jgi:hypothetical protein
MTDTANRDHFDEEPELEDQAKLSPIEGLVHGAMNVVVPAGEGNGNEGNDNEDDEPEA